MMNQFSTSNNHHHHNFTIVTPSEMVSSSSSSSSLNNISQIIKHKSGKVFRWHQDKLHTTLEGAGSSNPVKYSLGSVSSSPSTTGVVGLKGHKPATNKLTNNPNQSCRNHSPSISSNCSTTSSSSSLNSVNSNNQSKALSSSINCGDTTMNHHHNRSSTNGITKQQKQQPYKTRNNFKFFDYTMKKRKRTKRCDQVQPYENVISFKMSAHNEPLLSDDDQDLHSHNSVDDDGDHNHDDNRMESTLQQISQYCCNDVVANMVNLYDEPATTTTFNIDNTNNYSISVSTAPPPAATTPQPKTVRTSISIKELLN